MTALGRTQCLIRRAGNGRADQQSTWSKMVLFKDGKKKKKKQHQVKVIKNVRKTAA